MTGSFAAHEFHHEWQSRDCSGDRIAARGDVCLIFDTALIDSDHLPGHVHCDMLLVRLYRVREPILADTEVSEFADSERRRHCRSTQAHNTVSLDGHEQAETWDSFRVGRHGRPENLHLADDAISYRHNGFAGTAPGLFHKRRITFHDNGFGVVDELAGWWRHAFKDRWHFAPRVTIRCDSQDVFRIGDDRQSIINGATSCIGQSDYYLEFGLIRKRTCLMLSGTFENSAMS